MSNTDVLRQEAPTTDGTNPLAIINQATMAAYVAAQLAGYSPSVAAPAVVNTTSNAYTVSASNYGGAQTGLLVFTSDGASSCTINARTAGGIPLGGSLIVYNGSNAIVTLTKAAGNTFRTFLGNINIPLSPGYAVRVTKESGSAGAGVSVVDGLGDAFLPAKVTLDATAAVALGASHVNPVTGRGVLVCSDDTPTVTVSANSTWPAAIGSQLDITHTASDVLTIAADGGVTLNYPTDKALTADGQYRVVKLTKIDTDSWVVSGDLDPAA